MRSALNVEGAPKAIGPYSHAQVVRLHGGGRLVFTSGQVGLDPAKGELVEGGVAAQTERALANLEVVLRGAGLSLSDVVKTTVYLADMQDFQTMNEVYAKGFGDTRPPAPRSPRRGCRAARGSRSRRWPSAAPSDWGRSNLRYG